MPSDQILKALEDLCSPEWRAHALPGQHPLATDKESVRLNP